MNDEDLWLRCSSASVAALLGIRNIGFPCADYAVRVFSRMAPEQRRPAQDLTDQIDDSLGAYEHDFDHEVMASALVAATGLLDRFGLSDRALIELTLNAEKPPSRFSAMPRSSRMS